jgi:hypothetical protein
MHIARSRWGNDGTRLGVQTALGSAIILRWPQIGELLGNATAQADDVILTVDGRRNGGTVKISLPAQSVNTIVLGPSRP